MSFETVDVFALDSTPLHSPIQSVLVKVYNPAGSVFFTQGTTDALGHVGFLLETQLYSIRLFKFMVGFTQPVLAEILASPAVNKFNIFGEVFVPPTPTDLRLCRASGFFRDISGSPKRFLDIQVISKFSPILLDGSAVVTERQIIRTDEKGYAQMDLIRGGRYQVTIEAFEDCQREIAVPDTSSVNLPDLLFPVVDRVVFAPLPPYALLVGQTVVVTPTVLASDGRPLTGTDIEDVTWRTVNESIASVTVSSTTLSIRGNGAGITQLTAARNNSSIIRIPDTPIGGQPIDITVT